MCSIESVTVSWCRRRHRLRRRGGCPCRCRRPREWLRRLESFVALVTGMADPCAPAAPAIDNGKGTESDSLSGDRQRKWDRVRQPERRPSCCAWRLRPACSEGSRLRARRRSWAVSDAEPSRHRQPLNVAGQRQRQRHQRHCERMRLCVAIQSRPLGKPRQRQRIPALSQQLTVIRVSPAARSPCRTRLPAHSQATTAAPCCRGRQVPSLLLRAQHVTVPYICSPLVRRRRLRLLPRLWLGGIRCTLVLSRTSGRPSSSSGIIE